MIAPSIIARISTAVETARAKHHSYLGDAYAMLVLMEEIGEIAECIADCHGDEKRDAEILDAIAVLVRMLDRR